MDLIYNEEKNAFEEYKPYKEIAFMTEEDFNEFQKVMEFYAEYKDKASEWIPVSERLPEEGTYLCTFDGELVGEEEPFTGMCGYHNGKWDEECVIAWMPLPEPYKTNK